MRVVVSLTTIPSRMDRVANVIQNIFKFQTTPPDVVYLNIPNTFKRTGEPYRVSKTLDGIPGLVVNRVAKDYGPITKLLPTLDVEKDPNTCIIIIDDDIHYFPNMIETLVKKACEFPDYVITNFCTNIYTTPNSVTSLLTDCKVPEGFSGVLFRRKHFEDDFPSYVEKALQNKNCFLGDDYVLGSYLNLKQISIKNMFTLPKQYYDYGFEDDALHVMTFDNRIASNLNVFSRYNECYNHLSDAKMTNFKPPLSQSYLVVACVIVTFSCIFLFKR